MRHSQRPEPNRLLANGRCARGRRRLSGWLLAGLQDVGNADAGVVLAVAFEAAGVFPAAEMLDEVLFRGVLDHFADDAHAFKIWPADPGIIAVLEKQHLAEFDAIADLGVAEIDIDLLAFSHTVLSGAVFDNRVHGAVPSLV